MRALVIAGVSSGVGKTTVATGLMAAYARRGHRVQGFKVGPDYIDPTYHTHVSGRPSRNLDSWMLPKAALVELWARAARAADIAIIEGVMGLFDGRHAQDEAGSTAEVAKLLGAPVVLVVDVGQMARSAGALVLGYREFDPALPLAGVILNRVASESHRRWVTEAIQDAVGVPVLGALPKDEGLRLPERHLGLVPTVEGPASQEFFSHLAQGMTEWVDLDALWHLAAKIRGPQPSGPPRLFPERAMPKVTRIAVARDRAFSFYYQDNLDLLEAWGAEVVPFSPLEDGALPEGTCGIYLGGGFPELYAAELAANEAMKAELGAAAARGMPLYAECGGLMYLAQELVDFEGKRHPMVGLVPGASLMQRQRLMMGYITVQAQQTSPLLARGERVRGHEFHWSVLGEPLPEERAAYQATDQGGRREGYLLGNLLASYVHLHFGSRPDLAPNFVAACQRWAQEIHALPLR